MTRSRTALTSKKMQDKKAQAWGFDLFAAIIIFLFGILFFYFYTINYSNSGEENFSVLQREGETIADSLLSEGSPQNWNKTNLVRIGLITDGKINDTKLQHFYELARDNYALTKSLFRVNDDYYVSFQEPVNINSSSVEFIGQQPASEENIVKISRIVVYNNSIKTMNVHVWN